MDSSRSTFEISLCQDNAALCEATFYAPRRRLTVQEYMLSNKTEAAFRLLREHREDLSVPAYISEAIAWISA